MLAEFTQEKMWHEKKGNMQGGDGRKVIKEMSHYKKKIKSVECNSSVLHLNIRSSTESIQVRSSKFYHFLYCYLDQTN